MMSIFIAITNRRCTRGQIHTTVAVRYAVKWCSSIVTRMICYRAAGVSSLKHGFCKKLWACKLALFYLITNTSCFAANRLTCLSRFTKYPVAFWNKIKEKLVVLCNFYTFYFRLNRLYRIIQIIFTL